MSYNSTSDNMYKYHNIPINKVQIKYYSTNINKIIFKLKNNNWNGQVASQMYIFWFGSFHNLVN